MQASSSGMATWLCFNMVPLIFPGSDAHIHDIFYFISSIILEAGGGGDLIANPPKASTGVLQLVLKTECREHGPQSNASLSYKNKCTKTGLIQMCTFWWLV